MPSSKTRILAALAIGLLLIATLAWNWTSIAIAYHKTEMCRSRARISAAGSTSNQHRYIENFQWHKERLVRLGYFEKRTFQLHNIRGATTEMKRLLQDLHAFAADSLNDYSMPYLPGQAPALTIWDKPERMHSWEQLIHRHETNVLKPSPEPHANEP